MLLPDDIHPQNSIYYIGSLVLKKSVAFEGKSFIELYNEVKKEFNISFAIFILCLDWLYLIDALTVNENGVITKCT